MSHVVRVEFSGPARGQYYSTGGATLAPGDFVVVEGAPVPENTEMHRTRSATARRRSLRR